MTKEDVVAYKDESFLILYAKDRFNGVRVQLYAFIETKKQEPDGRIINLGVRPQLLEEIAVPFFKYGHGNRPVPTTHAYVQDAKYELLPVDAFRNEVIAAEAKMRTRMETVYRKTETMANGVLNDMRSKYKDLNDTGAGEV